MNFDFSEDVLAMREGARRFLGEAVTPEMVRRHAEGEASHDAELWRQMAEMGWLGLSIPEAHGGFGLGYEPLCMLAEEIGKALAPVPFASTLYLVTEALLLFGSPAQQARWLPAIAAGSAIGAFALAEGPGEPESRGTACRSDFGHLNGVKLPVFDGEAADILIVAARGADDKLGLYLIEPGEGVSLEPIVTLDPGRRAARLQLDGAPADPLPGAREWSDIECLLERAAVLFAFEQVGGAQSALDMATAYAMDRFAFGRPIASMQAIKHAHADVYVAVELARSNAYHGVWALEHDDPSLGLSAATARFSAIRAHELASVQNIQTHGGIGFTWEAGCHHQYRRAKTLSVIVGSAPYWRDRLVDRLVARRGR